MFLITIATSIIYSRRKIKASNLMEKFSWYLDITPNEMFSLYDYPIPGKDGLPLCRVHSRKLEMLEAVIFDREVTD